MTTPTIQALAVTQEGTPTRWKATGYVGGLGWLEVWGTSLVAALEAWQALAAQRDVPPLIHSKGDSHV
jgi:hypothetical protein